MSQSLPFCSAKPLMANSIKPQSYLQDYSTSVHLYGAKGREEDVTGMGPGEQQQTLLLEFLFASHSNMTVGTSQCIPGGKTDKNVEKIKVMLMGTFQGK